MHMGVTVSVISGKGGTGKTTLCAGIAACLAAEGKRVLCIDADIGLRNLDIALGMAEQPAVAFTDVTQGFCKLSDAAEHPALPGLFLLTAPVREQDALVEQQPLRCAAARGPRGLRLGPDRRGRRDRHELPPCHAVCRPLHRRCHAGSRLPAGRRLRGRRPLRSRGTSFCSSWSTACSRACFRA